MPMADIRSPPDQTDKVDLMKPQERSQDAFDPTIPCEPLPLQPDIPASKWRGFRFLLVVLLLLFSAYLGSIFIQGPLLPLALIAPKLFRRSSDWAIASWLLFSEFLIVKVAGVRVRHFGDAFSNDPSPRISLLLLNHRTQLDWLFAWGLGNPVQRMKIILKESLAKFPGAGWAMQCASFIFLRRQIGADQSRIDTLVSYLLHCGTGCELLIFPEGTNLTTASLSRSNLFAQKSKYPYVSYTLHPRCTGFVYLVTLIGRDRLQDIYDVTVAYPDYVPSPESDVLLGKVPSEVHYHVQRIPSSELPWDHYGRDDQSDSLEERLAVWLRNRWMDKEAMLKSYYDNPINERRFENEAVGQSCLFKLDSNTDHLHMTVLGLVNTVFWFAFLLIFTYYLRVSWTLLIFAILVQLVFIYLTHLSGGINIWASKRLNPPLLTGSARSLSQRSG